MRSLATLRRRAALACAGLGLAACAASTGGSEPVPADAPPRPLEQAAPPAGPPAEPASEPLIVALVGGQPIEAPALLESLWQWESVLVLEALEKAVSTELVRRGAEDLGVFLPQGRIDERFARVRADQLAALRARAGGASVDELLRYEYGMDPGAFFARMRAVTAEQLLAERVVRAHTLASERVEVSVIVAPSADEIAEARAAIEAGAPFADVARQRSVDPSAADGGRVAPILLDERQPLSRLAFATPVGEVGGPLEIPESRSWLLFRVDGRPDVRRGTWAEVGELVEASLAAREVGEDEYAQWRVAVERELAVDLRPFFELVGEPTP